MRPKKAKCLIYGGHFFSYGRQRRQRQRQRRSHLGLPVPLANERLFLTVAAGKLARNRPASGPTFLASAFVASAFAASGPVFAAPWPAFKASAPAFAVSGPALRPLGVVSALYCIILYVVVDTCQEMRFLRAEFFEDNRRAERHHKKK